MQKAAALVEHFSKSTAVWLLCAFADWCFGNFTCRKNGYGDVESKSI